MQTLCEYQCLENVCSLPMPLILFLVVWVWFGKTLTERSNSGEFQLQTEPKIKTIFFFFTIIQFMELIYRTFFEYEPRLQHVHTFGDVISYKHNCHLTWPRWRDTLIIVGDSKGRLYPVMWPLPLIPITSVWNDGRPTLQKGRIITFPLSTNQEHKLTNTVFAIYYFKWFYSIY